MYRNPNSSTCACAAGTCGSYSCGRAASPRRAAAAAAAVDGDDRAERVEQPGGQVEELGRANDALLVGGQQRARDVLVRLVCLQVQAALFLASRFCQPSRFRQLYAPQWPA